MMTLTMKVGIGSQYRLCTQHGSLPVSRYCLPEMTEKIERLYVGTHGPIILNV